MMWLTWLVTDAKRAKSFGTLVRMSAKAMATMELRVIPSLPRIKKIVKEIADQIGTEAEPCTIPSTMIVNTMLIEVLPKPKKINQTQPILDVGKLHQALSEAAEYHDRIKERDAETIATCEKVIA